VSITLFRRQHALPARVRQHRHLAVGGRVPEPGLGRFLAARNPSAQGSGKAFIRSFIEDIVLDSRSTDGSHWGLAEMGAAFYYTATTPVGTNTAGEFFPSAGICTTDLRYGIKDSTTGRIYAQGEDGVFFSPDNGDSWTHVYPKKDQPRDSAGTSPSTRHHDKGVPDGLPQGLCHARQRHR